jgi:hypothetical protein
MHLFGLENIIKIISVIVCVVVTTILILIIYVLVKCTIHAPFKIASTPLYMNKDLISILIPVSNSHTVNG